LNAMGPSGTILTGPGFQMSINAEANGS